MEGDPSMLVGQALASVPWAGRLVEQMPGRMRPQPLCSLDRKAHALNCKPPTPFANLNVCNMAEGYSTFSSRNGQWATA